MLTLEAENRDVFGKKLEEFRKKGKLPAVLYGPKEDAQSLFVSLKDFKKIWKEAGESTVIQLDLGKSKKEVLIQDVAMDPVKDEPIHVDFYAVLMDKPLQASIPLVFTGESAATKTGGILVKVMYEIEVEALPKNLPHELSVDISALADFGDKISAKDITLPMGVKLITNPDEAIILVEEPKAEEAAPPTEGKIAFEEIEVAGEKEKKEEEEKIADKQEK